MLLPESLRILELQARGLCILKPWDGYFAVWGSWVARVHDSRRLGCGHMHSPGGKEALFWGMFRVSGLRLASLFKHKALECHAMHIFCPRANPDTGILDLPSSSPTPDKEPLCRHDIEPLHIHFFPWHLWSP